ncbi:unnamed protein product, partial [Prorocentrum cordatum]
VASMDCSRRAGRELGSWAARRRRARSHGLGDCLCGFECQVPDLPLGLEWAPDPLTKDREPASSCGPDLGQASDRAPKKQATGPWDPSSEVAVEVLRTGAHDGKPVVFVPPQHWDRSECPTAAATGRNLSGRAARALAEEAGGGSTPEPCCGEPNVMNPQATAAGTCAEAEALSPTGRATLTMEGQLAVARWSAGAGGERGAAGQSRGPLERRGVHPHRTATRRERRERAQARRDLRARLQFQLLSQHHGSTPPTSASMGRSADYTVCKSCGQWWWNSKLEGMNYRCGTCDKMLPKPKSHKGHAAEAATRGGGGSSGSAGGGKASGKGKGPEQLAQALQLITASLGQLQIEGSETITKQIQVATTALQTAKTTAPQKPRAERMAAAARSLQTAQRQYSQAFAAKQKAEEEARKARELLEERASAVLQAEAECDAIHQEGKQAPTAGIIEQLVTGQLDELTGGQLAEDISKEFALDDDDLDEEARKQVEEAKAQVVKQMQDNAKQFQGHLREHLAKAKAAAIEKRQVIKQEAKKRKLATGRRRHHVGDAAAHERTLFCANISTWGPTARLWLLQQGIGGNGFDMLALQEMHVLHSQLDDAEQEPSHIDFAMTNDAGSKLITGVEGVYDVPWKPHIGLKFTIRGQGLATQCRTINLPKAFPHPPRKGKAPNPQSKRTKRRLQAKAKEEAEAIAAGSQTMEIGGKNVEELDDERWEALSPVAGWASFPNTVRDEVGQGTAPRPPSPPRPPCSVGPAPLGGHGGPGRDGAEAHVQEEYRHHMDDDEVDVFADLDPEDEAEAIRMCDEFGQDLEQSCMPPVSQNASNPTTVLLEPYVGSPSPVSFAISGACIYDPTRRQIASPTSALLEPMVGTGSQNARRSFDTVGRQNARPPSVPLEPTGGSASPQSHTNIDGSQSANPTTAPPSVGSTSPRLETRGEDTTEMGELWEMMELAAEAPVEKEAPEYIAKCAAYQATTQASRDLSLSFSSIMNTMEHFYCMAYRIDPLDRAKYCGRGDPRTFTMRKGKEKHERRERYANRRADWWSRAENTLSLLARLRKKNRDVRQQLHLEAAGRHLAYDGLPNTSDQASDTAKLHREIWRKRLTDLSKVDTDVILGMAQQAEQEKRLALKRDLQENSRAFAQWLARAEKDVGVLHRITKPPPRREEEVVTHEGVLDCPTKIVDEKAKAFQDIWKCDRLKHEQHTEAMRRVISDECCDALQLFHGNLLADIEKFYDSLQLDCVIEAGLRQTNNRAELFSLISFVNATEGKASFWTDSEVTCLGWAARREETTWLGCTNGDLWHQLGEAIRARGGDRNDISVHHLNSHMTEQEAIAKGITRRIWAGNQAAGQYADAGAKTHAISDTEMSCYEWVKATAHLVRLRIAATTKDVITRRPPDEKEMREARRAQAKKRRQDTVRKKDLLGDNHSRRPPTQHVLARDRRGTGWTCITCWQSVSSTTTAQNIHSWLTQECSGPPPETAITVTKFGIESHPAHKLRRLRRHNRWFCEKCGGATTELIAKKLQEPCCGHTACDSGHYRLQGWLRQAAREQGTCDRHRALSDPEDEEYEEQLAEASSSQSTEVDTAGGTSDQESYDAYGAQQPARPPSCRSRPRARGAGQGSSGRVGQSESALRGPREAELVAEDVVSPPRGERAGLRSRPRAPRLLGTSPDAE